VSDRQPVVLLIAREGVLHRALAAILADDCAFVGARTAAAALQLVRRRPPDIVLIEDSFADLDALVAGLQKGNARFRVIVLGTAANAGGLARLAAFGPVIANPLDHARLRDLVLATARLSEASGEHPGPASGPRVSRFSTTKIQRE
jgi:hypothetical protein